MQSPLAFATAMVALVLASTGRLRATLEDPQPRLLAAALSEAITGSGAEDLLLTNGSDKSKVFPERGLLVVEIVPGSFAASHEITNGCVILPQGRFLYDKRRSTHLSEKIAATRADENEVSWVTPDHKLRTATAPPGGVGFVKIGYRNVAYWYLNHGQRDARWDTPVLAAILCQGRDADAAESCWAAARAKGYQPDLLMHWSMAFILAARGDIVGSEAHADACGALRAPTSCGDFPLKISDWIQLGIRNGNMRRIKDSLDAFPFDKCNFTPASARALVELAASNRPGANPPCRLADKMKHRSFLREARTNGPNGKEKVYLPKLHHKAASVVGNEPSVFPPELVDVPLNHTRTMYLAPEIDSPNMEVAMEFKMRPHSNRPGNPSRFLRGFRFGLVNAADSPPGGQNEILSAALAADEFGDDLTGGWGIFHSEAMNASASSPVLYDRYLLAGKDQTLVMPVFRLDQDIYHTLRIVRVDGWAEALVDGKRIAHFPVPPECRRPWLFLQVVGSQVWIQSIRADVLESP